MTRPGQFPASFLAFAALAAAVAVTPAAAQELSYPLERETPNALLMRVDEAPAPEAQDLCRRLLTYLRVEIPPWEQANPWFAELFIRDRPTAEQANERAICADSLNRQLVWFEGGPPEAKPAVDRALRDPVRRTFGDEGDEPPRGP